MGARMLLRGGFSCGCAACEMVEAKVLGVRHSSVSETEHLQ